MNQMNQNTYESHVCSVSDVIGLIETAPEKTPIIVDFDETLFLRNSTEEYLNTLQPRVMGAVFLGLLNYLKPWHWLPGSFKGEISRDWLRVVISTLLFPWTLLLWYGRARQLAHLQGNTILLQAIAQSVSHRVIVATQGFAFIVSPLLKHMALPRNTRTNIIACRFWKGVVDRQMDKKERVTAALGADMIQRAIVVTDSTDDTSLLSSVAKPCLAVWPEAKYVPAMADAYIPFVYLERGKRPGQRYFLRVILGNDLVVICLATSWLTSYPLIHAASMTFLLLSFWCIYEVGYYENDLVAERFEEKPVLSKTYQRYKQRMDMWQPWIWALFFAFPGIILLELSEIILENTNLDFDYTRRFLSQALADMLCWFGLLLSLRVSYWAYNHMDKPTRPWLYQFLQIYKCFGFLVVTATNVIGVMLFAAQVLSRWISYIVYRNRTDWPQMLPEQLISCFIFGFLIVAVALGSTDFLIVLNWQALIIFMWCAFRARRQLRSIVHQMRISW
jgi:hypothetical protein